ncbi:MAG: 4Fe-4S binding protein [Clostridiales bacterium]|nr:4Fe-4S binding protein [Clostridiales bacterium]
MGDPNEGRARIHDITKEGSFHSVTLDTDKCQGCTHCLRHCPTNAIRVRGGKAHIQSDRCIDCGECIRVCPHHAKKAVYDKLQDFSDRFKWCVAIPAPSLYGQFSKVDDVDYVLTALKRIGFDDVFEVSRAAEIVSDYTRKLLMKNSDLKKPVISAACPAIVRLIRVRFPELCENVLPVAAPIEIAATMARAEAVEKTGLPPDEIGIFFISPCPAKVTETKSPTASSQSEVNGVIAIAEIYISMLSEIKKIEEPEQLSNSGIMGIGWASSGGESAALLRDRYLAADGISHCIKVLEEIENNKLSDVDFIELNACTPGCIGGALTVENPFVAKARIQTLRKYLPVSKNTYPEEDESLSGILLTKPIQPSHVLQLSSDVNEAMRMLKAIDEQVEKFPGIDCGACGAPTCRALAEDIILQQANESDCTFVLREMMAGMFKAFSDIKIENGPLA